MIRDDQQLKASLKEIEALKAALDIPAIVSMAGAPGNLICVFNRLRAGSRL
jgi:hypothetical protein